MIRPSRPRLPSHPYRTPWNPTTLRNAGDKAIIKAWLCACLVLAVAVFGPLLAACATTRSHIVAVGNVVATTVDAASVELLRGYCVASMRSLGRDGVYTDGRCRESGPNAGREATDAEREELARVRSVWRPVFTAHEVVVRQHNALVDVLGAAQAIDNNAMLLALSRLIQAYDELRLGAQAIGFQLPSVTGRDR
jgi:hypothetical protein